ncbi:retrovirus-related pol polyprotein from transposon TNT 1-94 [Tanacetum coccineum]
MLKRRLISVGQLDEEGYHVGFEDQQWKVTKGSLVVARGNKHGSLYMVEFGEAEEAFIQNVREDKETAEVEARVADCDAKNGLWKKAINEEMVSLEKNQKCSLVRLPVGNKASQRLWMFKVEEEQDGSKRYKARLVVRVSNRNEG